MSDFVRTNGDYLDLEIERLRLLLRRRALWLRHQWGGDPLEKFQGVVIGDRQAERLLLAPDWEAEELFYREDAKAVAVTAAIEISKRMLSERKHALEREGTQPACRTLADLFGLSEFEVDVLLLCLASSLDPAFEILFAYLQDDPARKYCTFHMALSLLPPQERQFSRNYLLPGSRLRRYRMVVLEDGAPGTCEASKPLVLDTRIAAFLCGVDEPASELSAVLHPVKGVPITESHRRLGSQLCRWFSLHRDTGRLPVLNLAGTGSERLAVAAATCRELSLGLHSVRVDRLPPAGEERREALQILGREAVLLNAGLYIDTSTLDGTGCLDDVIADLCAFLIIGSQNRWRCKRQSLSVEVSHLTRNEQVGIWLEALNGSGDALRPTVQEIAEQFDLGPVEISEVVGNARNRATLRENSTLTRDDLWQACRQLASGSMDNLAQRIEPCHDWHDIVLPKDTSGQLKEIAGQVSARQTVYETWGFGAKLNRGRGISVLFSGPSGSGKTMAAEILANHLQLDLYRIDLAGVVSKYIGETEKNIKKVFDSAEQSGAILFFDEADALFGKRSEVKDSHDRYANIEIDYLLQRMEDYRGLAILATNRRSELDRAFQRRIRFMVEFPLPDVASRGLIWQKSFPSRAPLDGVDFEALARLEITGGSIRNIAVNAAFLAASSDEIHMDHVLHAARREYAKLDKLITQSEFGNYYKDVVA